MQLYFQGLYFLDTKYAIDSEFKWNFRPTVSLKKNENVDTKTEKCMHYVFTLVILVNNRRYNVLRSNFLNSLNQANKLPLIR